jgi:hypothetical protein
MPRIDYHREQSFMNRNDTESAVDRLIAMAEDEKHDSAPPMDDLHDHPQSGDQPPPSAGSMAMLPDPLRGLEDNPMLKTLLQFRMLMPYLSPMGAQEHDPAMTGLSTELRQSVGDLTVQEQLVQMKRVEEEMHRTREATEKNAFESANLVEDMKSVYSLLKKTAGVLGVLVAALIGLAVWLLVKNPRLLH